MPESTPRTPTDAAPAAGLRFIETSELGSKTAQVLADLTARDQVGIVSDRNQILALVFPMSPRGVTSYIELIERQHEGSQAGADEDNTADERLELQNRRGSF
jgi:hypothetical protein